VRGWPEWQRWLVVAVSVIVVILVAYAIARAIRGSHRGAPAVPRASAPPVAPAAARAPAPTPAPPQAPPASRDVAPAAGSRSAPDPRAAGGDPPGSEAGAGEIEVIPDEDGEAVASGTPVVGSGPCRVTVATTPAGSNVRLDDQAMGPSPITIESSCDRHKLDVSHVRYQSVTRWVAPTTDKPETLDINLPRPVHAVTVTSFPPGAELSIDGHRAGTTPTVVQMMGFATVHLTFTKPGFQSVTRRVYSKLAQDHVFVKLMK
jgi:hypothetical protein